MNRLALSILAWVSGVASGMVVVLIFAQNKTADSSAETLPDIGQEVGALRLESEQRWGPHVPLAVREILLRDPSASEASSLSPLFRYLEQLAGIDTPPPENLPEAEIRWIADGVLNWMRRGCTDPEQLAGGLVKIAREADASSPVKEVALTHLGACRVSPAARARLSAEIAQLASHEPKFPWVGVAMDLLCREMDAPERPGWVRERCLKWISDSDAHVLCRIGALNLAARHRWNEAEPLARVQAVSSASVAEQVAALHVLAAVGNEETFRWLEKWNVPQDPFLAACWEEARGLLSERP